MPDVVLAIFNNVDHTITHMESTRSCGAVFDAHVKGQPLLVGYVIGCSSLFCPALASISIAVRLRDSETAGLVCEWRIGERGERGERGDGRTR
jgi:hypothetical protein